MTVVTELVAVSEITSLSQNSTLAIQPSSGVEWCIQNLFWGQDVELYFSDGTNTIKFDTDTGAGGRLGCVFPVTNAHYIVLKNVNASTANFGYSGVITRNA